MNLYSAAWATGLHAVARYPGYLSVCCANTIRCTVADAGLTSFRSIQTRAERLSVADNAASRVQDGSRSRGKSAGATPAVKSPLRRVATVTEAGGLGKKPSSYAKTDHDKVVKIVTAYCAAEQYRIPEAAKILKGVGYTLDPASTGLYPQVLHIQSSNTSSEAIESDTQQLGDIFVFPSGTIVAWDVEQETVMSIVSRGLLASAEKPQPNNVETEDLQYTENPQTHRSRLSGDRIELGTKVGPDLYARSEECKDESGETNLALARVAFSSGLARSVKLAVLENQLEAYFQSIKSIPDMMAQGGAKIPFTRRFIIRKTGERDLRPALSHHVRNRLD